MTTMHGDARTTHVLGSHSTDGSGIENRCDRVRLVRVPVDCLMGVCLNCYEWKRTAVSMFMRFVIVIHRLTTSTAAIEINPLGNGAIAKFSVVHRVNVIAVSLT